MKLGRIYGLLPLECSEKNATIDFDQLEKRLEMDYNHYAELYQEYDKDYWEAYESDDDDEAQYLGERICEMETRLLGYSQALDNITDFIYLSDKIIEIRKKMEDLYKKVNDLASYCDNTFNYYTY